MPDAKTCPNCGFEWSLDTPEDLCPRCLFSEALEQPADGDAPPVPGGHIGYFGDYELRREVARGGMGVVYEAVQGSLGRTVALKMILAGRFASQADVDRFHLEAEAAATLDHPAIVPLYEVGVFQGQHYLTMAFVEGESLAQRIMHGPLAPRDAAVLVREVANALAYAHDRGVVHRDLKPANVLLTTDGRPRITDFGLAKRLGSDHDLTDTGQVLGTPGYMAPEQLTAQRGEVREAADVYGLGALLYACLTGHAPFEDQNPARVLAQIAEQPPRSPRARSAAVPRDLETICLECLEKVPARRYPTARDVADELGRFLEGRPIVARPIGRGARLMRWSLRRPVEALLGVVAATAVVTLGIVGYLLQGELQPEAYGSVPYLLDIHDGHPRLTFDETAIVFEVFDLSGRLDRIGRVKGKFSERGGWVYEWTMLPEGGVSSTSSTWGPLGSHYASGMHKLRLNGYEFFLSEKGKRLLFEVEGKTVDFYLGEAKAPTTIVVGEDGVPRRVPDNG